MQEAAKTRQFKIGSNINYCTVKASKTVGFSSAYIDFHDPPHAEALKATEAHQHSPNSGMVNYQIAKYVKIIHRFARNTSLTSPERRASRWAASGSFHL